MVRMRAAHKLHIFGTKKKGYLIVQVLAKSGCSLCLQVAKNSLLLLSVAPSGLNMMKYFLLQTQVAQSFGGVECWTFGDKFPSYSVWCVVVFQLPNIVAQGSSLSGSVVPILSVFIQTFLEGSAG